MRRALLPVLLFSLAAASSAIAQESSCELRLAAVARYTPLLPREEPAECAVDDLVRLERVILRDRTPVILNPPPSINCAMAEQVAQWLRDDVAPSTAELGAPLLAVTDLDSYECRPRNRVAGAKMSEHGRGNALDIGSIKLGNGGVFKLTDPLVSKPFREALRASACARFNTVLGPGSDAYHNDHIHLDLAQRSRGYRMCQWEVRDPVAVVEGAVPLPRSKPAALIALQAKAR